MAFDLSWKDKVNFGTNSVVQNPVITTKQIPQTQLRVNSGTKNGKNYAIATIPITIATGRRIYDKKTNEELKDQYDTNSANITVDLAEMTQKQDGYQSSIPAENFGKNTKNIGAAIVIHERTGDKGHETMSFDIDVATVARMTSDAKQEAYAAKGISVSQKNQAQNRERLSTVQNFKTAQNGVASLSANSIRNNIIQGAASACLLSNGNSKYSKETIDKVADDFAKAYGTFMGSLIPAAKKKGEKTPLMTVDSNRLDFAAFEVKAGSSVNAVDKKTGEKKLDTKIVTLPTGLNTVFEPVKIGDSYTLASKQQFNAGQAVNGLTVNRTNGANQPVSNSIGNAMVDVNKAFNTLWKQQINSSSAYRDNKEMTSLANMFEINAFAEVPREGEKQVANLSVIQPQMQCTIGAFAGVFAKASNLATHKMEVTDAETGVTRLATLDEAFGADTIKAVNDIYSYATTTSDPRALGVPVQTKDGVDRSKSDIADDVQAAAIAKLREAVGSDVSEVEQDFTMSK